jgi:hypothetical protein
MAAQHEPDGMPKTVGDVLTQLLVSELESERKKKDNLENRGLAIITTSGVLATLLLSLAAALVTLGEVDVTRVAMVSTIGAAGLFTLAAILGVIVNLPLRYDEIEPESLCSMTSQTAWALSGGSASRQIAVAQIDILSNWRAMSRLKARVLVTAALTETLAVGSTLAAIFYIVKV